MPLTADVKTELAAMRDPRPAARVAEVTAILRFAGGLHSIAGRVAVELRPFEVRTYRVGVSSGARMEG